jgi:hypothetical protein
MRKHGLEEDWQFDWMVRDGATEPEAAGANDERPAASSRRAQVQKEFDTQRKDAEEAFRNLTRARMPALR